ncbi:MAG: hypothetical protein ACQERJ_07810 [Bacillota bacterium]
MVKDESGLTMILTIFVVVILLSLIYAFSTIIQTQNDNIIFQTKATKAFYGAEAGVETALAYLNQVQGDFNQENYIKGQLDNVNYKVSITKDDLYKYHVESKGKYQGITKTIVARLEAIDNNHDGKQDGLVVASWREY